MKILYLSTAKFPSEVSHTLSIMRVCQALTDSHHEVVLTGRAASDQTSQEVIEHYGLRGNFKLDLHKINKLAENPIGRRLLIPGLVLAWKTYHQFMTLKPDVVYSRLTITELIAVPAKMPIIFEMHSLGPLGHGGIAGWAFRKIMRYKNVVRIIVTTHILAEQIKHALPGVDVAIAQLSAEPPLDIPTQTLSDFKERHLQGKAFTQHAGYTGYLDTIGLRGTDILCQIAANMPDVAFHIVGGEPHIVDHWRVYAKNYNQHQNIFFYGYRKPAEMPLFLNCFDVVLAPLQLKINERAPNGLNMSPLKLPQYLSYGRAIVASDLPSHREVLENESNALLVPAADISAWVAAIKRLLTNASLREKLAQAGFETYNHRYTPQKRVEAIFKGIGLEH